MKNTNLSSQPSKRLEWLDVAKGIAIILVVVGHSSIFSFIKTHSYNPAINYFYLLLQLGFASYMAAFYFFSGYTYKQHTGTITKKLKRLLIPYAFWGCFYLLITWAFLGIHDGFSFSTFFRPAWGLLYSRFSLFPIDQANSYTLFPLGANPLWFLTSLCTSYILFLLLLQSKKRIIYIALLVILTVAFSFLPILLPWSLDTAPAGALFIYAGYMIKNLKLFDTSIRRLFALAVIVIPFYIILTSFNGAINMSIREYGKFSILSPLLFIVIGLIGSILFCIFGILLNKLKISSLLASIGKISLTLMCSHMFVLNSEEIIFSNGSPFLISILTESQYLFILQITSSIFIAFIINILLNKIKSSLFATKNTTLPL